MDEQTMRSQGGHAQAEAIKMAAPLQAAWKKVYFDLPLAMLSETMRFAGRRLQAQSDFLSGLRTCRTVPDMIETQSTFVRAAVNDYGAETDKVANDIRSSVDQNH